ncbi:MAG: S8 family serine peptidase [Bradymonadaceae bacterium]|nr:S8 family serine peptidase [Lujinxingiaceae bacterium]
MSPPVSSQQIDPTFAFLQKVIAVQGAKSPVFGPSGQGARGALDIHGTAALLRFDQELDEAQLAALEKQGVRFERRHDGQLARIGTIYRAWIRWSALEALSDHPNLIRAEAGWAPGVLLPLEVTGEKLGAHAAHILPGLGVDGKTTLIGNIDSGIDVLHPAFFHADGGLFDWIDVNANGRFDAGIDAVDLNKNGVADRNEVLRVLDGSWVQDFRAGQVQNRDGVLQTRLDWLYADMNRDSERNVGRTAGFDEQSPAYGEPLFVVDDVNANGRLDPGEKLVLLKTSKIKKYIDNATVYERGINLIDAGQAEGLANAHHGTGVSGILVGGQPGYHDRIGLAPGADLIVYGFSFTEGWETTIMASFIEDALHEQVDVLLHEWTNCFTRSLDGSTNMEAAMDHARAQGMIQINPLGNLNRSQKHIRREVVAGAQGLLSFEVGNGFAFGPDVFPYTLIYGTVQWRGPISPAFALRPPGGEPVHVYLNADTVAVGNALTHWTHEATLRDTNIATFYLWSADQQVPVQAGEWAVIIDDVFEDESFFGRISDSYSGWSLGVGWKQSTTDAMTLCFPATADSAVAVGAYGGRHDLVTQDGSRVGQLRNFSGRGPRLDGRANVALTAPDDPFTALAATPQIVATGWGRSWYATFGGTSGAGPHVAAAAALVRERYPQWTAAQIEQRLFESADRDALVPEPASYPDNHWGWGKLNVYRALYGAPARANRAPTAVLSVDVGEQAVVFDAGASSDPDGDRIEFRFDFDYDGVWDEGWTSAPRASVAREFFELDRPYFARLEVRDGFGARAGALVEFTLFDPTPDPVDVGADEDVASAPNNAAKPTTTCLCATSTSTPSNHLFLLLLLATAAIVRRSRRRPLSRNCHRSRAVATGPNGVRNNEQSLKPEPTHGFDL